MSGEKHMYDLVEDRRVKRASDPVSEALAQEEEDLAAEARRLRLQALVEERKKKVQSLQGAEQMGFQGGVNPPSQGATLLAMLIAQGMAPDKSNEYIKALDNESIMKLSLIGAQNQNALLPLIMLAGKQGTSTEDIVKLVGAIIAIAKPSGDGGNNAMLTKLITETIPNMQNQLMAANTTAYQAQILQLRQEMQEMKPKNSAEYVKEVADAASALGMRSGSDVNLEVKKLELEDAREVRRINADRENTREIIGTVKDLIEGRAGAVLEKIGDAGAERIRGAKAVQAEGETPHTNAPQTLMVQCGKCGGTFQVGGGSKEAKCPHCGADLKIEFKPPSQAQGGDQAQAGQDQLRVPQFGGGSGEFAPRWSGPPEKEQ